MIKDGEKKMIHEEFRAFLEKTYSPEHIALFDEVQEEIENAIAHSKSLEAKRIYDYENSPFEVKMNRINSVMRKKPLNKYYITYEFFEGMRRKEWEIIETENDLDNAETLKDTIAIYEKNINGFILLSWKKLND